MGHAVIQ